MKIELHPLSLLVGAALALTIGAQAVQRTAVIAPPVQAATLDCPKTVPWPPHPEDIWELPWRNPGDPCPPLVSQEWTPIFESPADPGGWLVITQIRYNSTASVFLMNFRLRYPDGSVLLLRHDDDAFDIWGDNNGESRFQAQPNGVGIVMPAGSVFEAYPAGGGNQICSLAARGYIVDA